MHSVAKTLLVLLFLSFVGVLGCNQRGNAGRSDARIRDLQSRNAKWEEDYRVVTSTNGTLRKQLAQHKAQMAELQEKLQQMEQLRTERDQLRAEMQTRISERNTAQSQLLQFHKDLAGLVDRMQTATRGISGSATAAAHDSNVRLTSTTHSEID